MMNAALPMMNRPAALLLSCVLLASCSSIPMPSFLHSPASEAVVYALGPREGFTSPLNGSHKPACPALVFENADFQLTSAHQQALNSLAQEMTKNKKARLLVAGYTAPNLPADHARSLSERRALAVRQRLIELGLDAASVQTVGFGNDFSPSGPSSDVVVIYRQN
jgi:hypothetical protein